MFDLSDEVAVVIGATGVLGGAMASGLAAAGAKVAVLGRNSERGQARAKAILNAGGSGIFVPCDATDAVSLKEAHGRVIRELGTVTVLLNTAGGNSPGVTVRPEMPFEAISMEDWRENFDMNLVGGVVLPCQVFGPAMVVAGLGSIINTASVSAHQPLSRVGTYSAAKAAVVNLTQFLAREWAPGVRVNSITPGFFPGEQNRRLLFEENGEPTERGRQILGQTPMHRFGEPEELIGAAVFLASAAASGFVTGTDLKVDGGFLAMSL